MIGSSASPGLAETIAMGIDRFLSEVHTCMPATVVSYDYQKQTATVQPSIKEPLAGEVQTLPQIPNVPVYFPATANAWIRLPVAAGDQVMLHFAERSLDKWNDGDGSPVDPGTLHRHHLSDAIATPGLRPASQAISPKGAETSVEITNGSGWIEITPSGKFKVSNGTVELLVLLDTIIGHIKDLTTTNAIVGSPCTLSPVTIGSLAADIVQLELLKT